MTATGIGTLSVRAILAAFSALGLDTRQIQRSAGIRDEELADPDGMLAPPRFYAMWDTAIRAWNRPALGLRAGLTVPQGAFEVLDYLIVSSRTLEQALGQVVEYFAVATTTARYELHSEEDGAFCQMSWTVPPHDVMFHLRDFTLATLATRVHAAHDHRPELVELTAPLLGPVDTYQQGFGARVQDRSERNGLLYATQSLRAPHARADDALNRTLRRHAQMLLQRQPEGQATSTCDLVRVELLRASEVSLVSLEVGAKRLSMSPRTLQRRLRDEGTTFAEVREGVLESLARAYLSDRGLSIGEVAYLLGFSEASAFSRAFKRWTGDSPQAYRSQSLSTP